MLNMPQINNIRDLSNCGYKICEISKITGTDRKTVVKSRGLFTNTPSSRRTNIHT